MAFEVIPAIDIKGGKCVQMVQGVEGYAYSADPIEMAKLWRKENSKALHVTDVDGATEGRLVNFDVIERMGSLSHEDAEFLRGAATFYRALDHGQRLSVGHAEGSLPPSRSQFDVLTDLVKRWTPERLHAQPLDATLREIRGRTREFFDRVFGGA